MSTGNKILPAGEDADGEMKGADLQLFLQINYRILLPAFP